MYMIIQANGRVSRGVATADDSMQAVVDKILGQHPNAVVRRLSDDRAIIWPSRAAMEADSGNGEQSLCEIRRIPEPPTET